ncbi:MAG: alanine--tRNA ligase, partial [Chitinophagales bacterium]|nr:alanine--tRNA ligase [Hyphomicrobiales bacterium]
QGKHDNYETDLFQALIKASADATGVAPEGKHKVSHRVIADHLRSASFIIADGVLPSNEGRGYVLRRIMRRAMRHGTLLGATEPLIYKLVPALIREMGQAYSELIRAETLITETLKLEETRFRKTLDRGLILLDEATAGFKSGASLPGDVAFKLYDTYGFPLDLTQDALKARNIGVDTDGFNAAMALQRAEARKNWSGSGEAATEKVWFELKERLGTTEFLGYATEKAEGQLVSIVKAGKEVKSLKKGEEAALIFNQTPFYAESGGQVGDTGLIRLGKNGTFRVSDTKKKLGDLFVHYGVVENGPIKSGEAAELEVDRARRTAIRANHSGTHLAHEALRQVLGTHVAQKGSSVDDARLRFDFSHNKPMSGDEIARAEDLANAIILQNEPIVTRLMQVDEAIESGAMALFGEKYGDEVRVVSMGMATEGDKSGKSYSVELCGGTHASRTGDIGLIKILSESGVSAGVRRIEAVTAEAARRHLTAQDTRMREVADLLKTKPDDVPVRLAALIDDRKKLERELVDARKKIAMVGNGAAGDEDNGVRTIGAVRMLGRMVHGVAPKDLRGLVDDAKRQIGSGVVAIVGISEDGKAGIVVGVTQDLTQSYSAVDLVRAGAGAIGGAGGGGRPDLAQAGGPDGANAEAALEAIASLLAGD